MGIVDEKYNQLKPEFRYLWDEVVLAQSWKKSHSYIRSHNWYADTLELDCSAVNLQARIKEWSEGLRNHTYKPSNMKMVPAPKSDYWTFYRTEGGDAWKWGPKKPDANASECKELRPLAHLNIHDQTIATTIMLCLADAVETEQGSTASNDVSSYGNRLFCDWRQTKARFRWGNSSTYSKYFEDYQRFLERPIKKAEKLQAELPPSSGIYEIHLDLAAFFDSIIRRQLVRKLKIVAAKHYEVDPDESKRFWDVVSNVFLNWKWAEEDMEFAPCLKTDTFKDGEGLPQGLVASGFFANVYLLSLDRCLSSKIGQVIGDVSIVDYCRYVDDLRLLVHVSLADEFDWEKWVKDNIQPLVERTRGIKLNSGKTKVERYTAKRSGVSVRMKAIQRSASGPQDMAALDEMQGSLEGLLAIAEQYRDLNISPLLSCDIPLANVDQPQMDVGEDTLLRFSANRLFRTLSEKRSFAANGSVEDESISELDHVQETFARRFVAIWTRNPSLVAILRKGLQLFPHQQLLKPVFDALFKKLGPTKSEPDHKHMHDRERLIAFYCIAEVFRFAALELFRQEREDRPQHSDWEGLNRFLVYKSRELLAGYPTPWYVAQQIALFMAVNEEHINLPGVKELEDSRLLFRILHGDRRFGKSNALEKRVPLFVVAFQISSRPQQIVATLSDWVVWLCRQDLSDLAAEALREVATNSPSLYGHLLDYGRQIEAVWWTNGNSIGKEFGYHFTPLQGRLCDNDGTFLPIARILKRDENPFAHENALLALAIATLDFLKPEDVNQLAPHHLEVKCDRWDLLTNPEKSVQHLALRWLPDALPDARYEPPVSWMSGDVENPLMYRIGSFLRACATGDLDFTVGQHLMREHTIHAYFGLKSSWYKRRMGMAHRPEALNGEAAPMSSWVSELLYRLLQWPGLEIHTYIDEWPERLTKHSLKKLLIDRLAKQEEIYGKASKLPVYMERICHDFKDEQILRVVMAQSLLPKKADFKNEGPLLNNSTYRAKHRQHVATMARLICEKILALKQVEGFEKPKPFADLIVFPELAVHEDDLIYLKRLADKTGAMVFTGLVYRRHPQGLVNTALWLIPFNNGHGRQWIMRYQGKQNPTTGEKALGINPWRPYQLVIELTKTLKEHSNGFRLSGAICYDATDISLAADMKEVSNAFIVSALNKDIDTFDTMVDALHYHMYQPVILVNTGEFGGSVAKAPYKERYHKQIAHVHGNDQIAISIFELNMYDFAKELPMRGSGKKIKTKPAGLKRLD